MQLELFSDKKVIKVKGMFSFLVRNKKVPRDFTGKTVNDIGLPHMNANFGMAEA